MKVFPKFISLGDACIVACKPGTGRNAMPSKIWSIMSCGRPVIASFDKNPCLEIISKEKCGVFAQAGDVDALIIQIKKLRQNSKLCKEMGTNARRYIEMNLSRKKSTERLVRIIEMTKEEYKSNESIIY
ncbi:MAG: glycosyltransferase [Enterocloster clostridioformis]